VRDQVCAVLSLELAESSMKIARIIESVSPRAMATLPYGRARPSGCPFRKSYPAVLVMQPSQDRNSDNGARSLDSSMQWRIFLQCQMRARLILIRRISAKNPPQVRLTKADHLVQTLATQGADQTFRIAILPRRLRRDRSARCHRRMVG
jgi:hypothetical protein